MKTSSKVSAKSYAVSVFGFAKLATTWGRKGMKDDEIIPLLCSLRRPTFFTRDLGFYERDLCHAQYCLVCIAVGQYEAAAFVRRLLRHPEFDTQAKRMGTVIRVSRGGLRVWRLHAEQDIALSWSD